MGGGQNRWRAVPIALAGIFTVAIVLPLISMFSGMSAQSIQTVFQKSSLWQIIGNSVLASGLTTVISIALAYLLAWCLERTNMAGKRLFSTLVTLPMLIPSVSIGMGVVLLGGNNGLLTHLFGGEVGGVYGLTGIVWGSTLYSLPVAFLMIHDILKGMDRTPYEAAMVLGIPKWRQFTAITLPYLRKPMISVAFAVFTLSFTDYGVPLMVGGKFKTLPMLMYQEVIGQLDFGKGCVYGSILLIPAVLSFLIDRATKDDGSSGTVRRPVAIRSKKWGNRLAFVYSGLLSLGCVLPIGCFALLAFVENYPVNMVFTLDNIAKTFRMGGGDYLLNSVVIAVLVSVIGTALAVAAAYYTARSRARGSRYLHLISMAVAAVPGVVLGLAYILFFGSTPLYGTLAILVMVNIVHFFASPYLMIYNAFGKIDGNLEAVAATLGIGGPRFFRDILLPRCRGTIREMLAYFFVNSMMTISAVSLLAGPLTKPLALLINRFEAQAQLECAAVVSVVILAVNLLVKALLQFPDRKCKRMKGKKVL